MNLKRFPGWTEPSLGKRYNFYFYFNFFFLEGRNTPLGNSGPKELDVAVRALLVFKEKKNNFICMEDQWLNLGPL